MLERAGGLMRLPMVMCMLAWPMALAGCTSFALDDGVSRDAPKPEVVGVRPAPQPVALTKLDTGTYPTFGKPLTAANTQIDDQQFTTAESQLSKLASARAKGAVSEAEYQRRVAALKKLASDQAAAAAAEPQNTN